MAKKEFTYRGKTLDELQEMSVNEFAELVPSRIRRSIKRGFNEEQKTFLENLKKKDRVKTHCRDMVFLPMMVGKVILLHKGNKFEEIRVEAEMLGHVLGEFVLTRSKVGHSAPGVGATKSSSSVSVR